MRSRAIAAMFIFRRATAPFLRNSIEPREP